jgi:hypothetical protein
MSAYGFMGFSRKHPARMFRTSCPPGYTLNEKRRREQRECDGRGVLQYIATLGQEPSQSDGDFKIEE